MLGRVENRSMARVYLFGDEAGTLSFTRERGASRYFIITTIATETCDVGHALYELRHQLAWEGVPIYDQFHAAEDKQIIRDRVFQALAQHKMRIDATIFDKPKTQPRLTRDGDYFYKLAWFYHLRHVVPKISGANKEVLVTAASLGTNRKRELLAQSVADVVRQVSGSGICRTGYWPAATDPCLQAADYCCWAIQRKWEKGDDRSFRLIADQVASEFDIFAIGRTEYY
jgi:Protein of unknown function (DUF3800)